MCDEQLPEAANERLLCLFNKREELRREVGPRGPGVAFADLQICAAITQEKQREKYVKLGERNDWPQVVAYKDLPARILNLKESLLDMIQDPDILKNSFIWQNFLSSINSCIFQFASSESKLAFTYALYGRRCG